VAATDDLLASIFGDTRPPFYASFESWVRGSRRFKDFATRYHTKIQAKLKNVRDDGGSLDLQTELEVAAVLLREDRFTLEYETYTALKQRGPDFTVTFKTHTAFNVEVRRIRSPELTGDTTEAGAFKLMAVLCDKVRQMPPSIINWLWLSAEGQLTESDLAAALANLRQFAERKDDEFFTRRGYKNAVDFIRHFQQLSGILFNRPGERILWLNPLARHKAPPEIVNALRRLGYNVT
jgi:hypothetical protein